MLLLDEGGGRRGVFSVDHALGSGLMPDPSLRVFHDDFRSSKNIFTHKWHQESHGLAVGDQGQVHVTLVGEPWQPACLSAK